MRTADAREHYLVHWPAARPWTRTAIRTRNPLLRVPTRRERVVTRVAFGGLVLLVSLMALLCLVTFQRGAAAERVQSASRHQVAATVVSSGAPRATGDRFLVPTRARVSYVVDGTTRTATLPSSGPAPAGATLTLWVDRAGGPVAPPQSRSLTVRNTLLVGLLGLAIVVVLASAGRSAYDEWSLRQHLDEWDVDWVRFNLRRRN